MIFMNPNIALEIARQRQADLRVMARQHPAGHDPNPLRQRLGRLVQLIGRSIEGCQPEIIRETLTADGWQSRLDTSELLTSLEEGRTARC